MRRRKTNRHLPQCVYLKHGAYWLVRKGKWERLGANLQSALAAYAHKLEEPAGTMATLIDEAMKPILHGLAPNTVGNYLTAARRLKYAFASFRPEQVKLKDVWRFRDAYADTPNMTNRCLSLLRQIFDYAAQRGVVEVNPAYSVKAHPEKGRTRLISWGEFQAIRAHAVPRLQVIMDLLYLTGQRVNDVLRIRYADLREDGIYFQQAKTDTKLLVKWSSELRAAVDHAKNLHGNVKAMTLLHNRRGKAPDYRSVHMQWSTARERSGVPDANMQDIRAMSLTGAEAEGKNPTALAGHSSAAMTKRYLRNRQAAVVEGPSLKGIRQLIGPRS